MSISFCFALELPDDVEGVIFCVLRQGEGRPRAEFVVFRAGQDVGIPEHACLHDQFKGLFLAQFYPALGSRLFIHAHKLGRVAGPGPQLRAYIGKEVSHWRDIDNFIVAVWKDTLLPFPDVGLSLWRAFSGLRLWFASAR